MASAGVAMLRAMAVWGPVCGAKGHVDVGSACMGPSEAAYGAASGGTAGGGAAGELARQLVGLLPLWAGRASGIPSRAAAVGCAATECVSGWAMQRPMPRHRASHMAAGQP